jgi:hypothetical protein
MGIEIMQGYRDGIIFFKLIKQKYTIPNVLRILILENKVM